MRRWHEDFKIAFREWKKHYNSHVKENIRYSKKIGKSPFEIDCICDKQIGRFRKKDAWDCGKSACYICHNDKLSGDRSRQEELSELDFHEQLKELN